jgi:hypothetical protein
MWEDPIVKEVREIRKELSARFNFDVHAIFEDLRKKQITIGSQIIRHRSRKKTEKLVSREQNSATLHPGR